MKINEDLWSQNQYDVLADFVHHLAYYRVLSHFYNDSQIRSEYWTKVVIDEQYQCDFRCHRNKLANMTENQMGKFWSSMTNFRNKYAVHRTAATQFPAVPYMDTALIIATSYDGWFRLKVKTSFEEPSLNERYERLLRISEKFFKELIGCGPTIDQEYEGRLPERSQYLLFGKNRIASKDRTCKFSGPKGLGR